MRCWRIDFVTRERIAFAFESKAFAASSAAKCLSSCADGGPGFELQHFRRLFQRTRWRLVKLLNPRLRLFAQNGDNPIQLIEKKNVSGPAGELNDEACEK